MFDKDFNLYVNEYRFDGKEKDIEIYKEKVARIISIASIRRKKKNIERIIKDEFKEIDNELQEKEINEQDYNSKVLEVIKAIIYKLIMNGEI